MIAKNYKFQIQRGKLWHGTFRVVKNYELRETGKVMKQIVYCHKFMNKFNLFMRQRQCDRNYRNMRLNVRVRKGHALLD